VGSAALGVAHATSGITANVLTLRLANSILSRDQLNPYLQGAQGIQKRFEEPESKQSKMTGPPQRQAVNKLNPRIMQRTVRAKRAIPLPLPRSRSRDSQLEQIETNASATTAQPITIP
jgi:hypothetical protein